jgi:hypothetical protein
MDISAERKAWVDRCLSEAGLTLEEFEKLNLSVEGGGLHVIKKGYAEHCYFVVVRELGAKPEIYGHFITLKAPGLKRSCLSFTHDAPARV